MYERKIGVVFLGRDTAYIKTLYRSVDRNLFTVLSVISKSESVEMAVKCLTPEAVVIDDSFDSVPVGNVLEKINKMPDAHFSTIALTSRTEDAQVCWKAGLDYFMVKPVDAEQFWSRLYLLVQDRRDRELARRIATGRDLSEATEKEREIMRVLYCYGLNPKWKGFGMLKTAVSLIMDNAPARLARDIFDSVGGVLGQPGDNVRRNIVSVLHNAKVTIPPREFISMTAFRVQENLRERSERRRGAYEA